METVKDRIISFIQQNELTVKAFERKTGLSNGAVSKMGNSPRSLIVEKIINTFPELSRSWLLTGEGEMYIQDEEPKPEISYTEGVPYYDVDFECGFDELMHPGAPNPECLIRMPGFEKATMWCNATGHSMDPEISNGDIIALQWIEDFSFLPYGSIYAIITTNGLRTIKRLGRSDNPACYRLIPANPEYDAQDIPLKMIWRVYRVMGSVKSF